MDMFYESSLTHHGILGQKWGKRNGPPYPLDASDHSSSEKKAGWQKSVHNSSGSDSDSGTRKDKNYNDVKLTVNKVAKDTTSAINSAKKINNTIASKKAKKNAPDPSKMSDAELRATVSRMNLEKQYVQLSSPQYTKGHQVINDVLDVGGSVVAATAGAATLALTVMQLKKMIG